MPYANNQGTRIYYEVEGEGPPIVLLHGMMDAQDSWREKGVIAALRDRFCLILIDSRGHGRSDKPHEPEAYESALQATDVTAVLDDLKLARAHCWGFSLGAQLGFYVALHSPERVVSLIAGGMHPYRVEPQAIAGLRELIAQGLGAVVAAGDSEEYPYSEEHKARLLACDPEALLARLDAPMPEEDLIAGLRRFRALCLFYSGDRNPAHDGVKRIAAEMPNCEFVSLSGLDHRGVSANTPLVLSHVLPFLEQAESGG